MTEQLDPVPVPVPVPVAVPVAVPVPVRRRGRGLIAELVLVAVGGALGTLARYSVGLLLLSGPAATLAVNITGALALGALVSLLSRVTGRVRWSALRTARLRLALGTGVLGGFTTYSGFATVISEMVLGSEIAAGLGYAAITIVGGLAASLVGLWLGGRGQRLEQQLVVSA